MARLKASGLSLIEMAVVMAFVALALVPVVQMIGKPSTDAGNVGRLTAMKSQEVVLANAVVERALSGDYTVISCGGAFDADPAGGTDFTRPTTMCDDEDVTGTSYGQDLYYQWTMQDVSTNLPDGNYLYQATLNVYRNPSDTTPLLTVPTFLHYNAGIDPADPQRTGLVVVQDTSGSMLSADGGLERAFTYDCKTLGAPYLRYRYADPDYPTFNPLTFAPPAPDATSFPGGGNNKECRDEYLVSAPWGLAPLNFDDNAQLDIVKGKQADDPATEWDDRYPRSLAGPGNSTTGLPNDPIQYIAKMLNGLNFSCPNTAGNITSPLFRKGLLEANDAPGNPITPVTAPILAAICKSTATPPPNANSWTTVMNTNMSRIEAARSALLAMVATMEQNVKVRDNLSMGFVNYDAGITPNYTKVQVPKTGVALETINDPGADNPAQFDQMRRRVSWINREGPGGILAGGATPTATAMVRGAQLLTADPNVQSRILLLVSDGEPNTDTCGSGHGSHNCYRKFSEAITTGGSYSQGGLSYNGGGKPITIFTLGLIDTNDELGHTMRDSIACWQSGGTVDGNDQQRSPCLPAGNSYSYAADIGEIDQVFEQLSYQIQTEVMINATKRYAGFDNL